MCSRGMDSSCQRRLSTISFTADTTSAMKLALPLSLLHVADAEPHRREPPEGGMKLTKSLICASKYVAGGWLQVAATRWADSWLQTQAGWAQLGCLHSGLGRQRCGSAPPPSPPPEEPHPELQLAEATIPFTLWLPACLPASWLHSLCHRVIILDSRRKGA